jgi:hypothetical protein
MSKHEVTLHAAAARLEAVAGVCGIRRLSLQAHGRDGLVFVGDRLGVAVTIRLAGLGSRAVRTAVLVEATGSPVELTLRPELAGERLDKALGMTVDAEVGDRVFDDRFVIESAPVEAARKVLTAPVREALLAFPLDDDSPRVRLGEGIASIAWGREPDPSLLQHALGALVALRDEARALHEGLREVSKGMVFRQDGGDAQKVDPREREAARSKLRSAKARAVVVIGSAVAAGIGFLATVILGNAA